MLMERSRSPYYVLGLSRRLPVSPETRPEGYLAYFAQGGPEAPRRTHTDRWMLPPSTHSLFPEEGVAVLYATVGPE